MLAHEHDHDMCGYTSWCGVLFFAAKSSKTPTACRTEHVTGCALVIRWTSMPRHFRPA